MESRAPDTLGKCSTTVPHPWFKTLVSEIQFSGTFSYLLPVKYFFE